MKSVFQSASRITILANFIFLAFAVIVIRLFYLQIIQGSEYKKLANREQIKQDTIPAHRGLIYAMDGKKPIKLVMNETIYTVFIDPKVDNPEAKAEAIKLLREVAGGNLKGNIEDAFKKRDSRYEVVATKLSHKQADAIASKKNPYIGLEPVSRRVYPEGQLASQVLGFVNYEGGKYGIESSFNKELTGKDGLLKTAKDVLGAPLVIGSENIERPPVNGKNIVLSIDRNIQAQTEKVLQKHMQKKGMKNGSVLVMNPNNGKVLAMANYPTYDPSKFGEVKDGSVFNNNTVTMPYENGSVIKSFTMAMGINEGVAKGQDTYYNADFIKVEDRTIKNAALGHTGQITFQTAMNYSLNTGMVTIANRLGSNGQIDQKSRNTIYDYLHNRFGLGQKTGIEVTESTGTVIPPNKVEGNNVRYSNMAFGQGMDTTMIQTATAFSSLINGGNLYRPSLINGEVTQEGVFEKNEAQIHKQNVISEDTSKQIKQILISARANANRGGVDSKGYNIGGKTGTSQTLIDGKYVDNQTIGSYLGFGGGKQSEYVIMVAVWGKNQNLQGHSDASPIFTDISNWMLNYLEVKPTEG